MPDIGSYDYTMYPQMGTLRDTWGMKCGHVDNCDEVRTIGVEVLIIEDDKIPEIIMYAFCEKHLHDYLHEYMFGREISGMVRISYE